jgi:nucleoside-diphosphate-sugar epimerase
VEDVVEAFVLAAQKEIPAGEVFNVAGGVGTSLLELIDVLKDLFNSELEPRFEPARPGEVRRSRSDVSKAQRILGWRPRWALAPALQECIANQPLDGLLLRD